MDRVSPALAAERRTAETSVPEVARILAADDEPDILEIYQGVLVGPAKGSDSSNFGTRIIGTKRLTRRKADAGIPPFELTICSHGAEALEAVEKALEEGRPYSVAFLDLNMPPGIDGAATAQRVRALDPQIEIVMVTGSSGGLDSRNISARVQPADKLLYVQKPFYPDEIRHLAAALSVKHCAECQLRSIRNDLQDVLGQQLTDIALLSEALEGKLGDGSEDQVEAAEITRRVNQAISLARELVKGLRT